MHPLRATYRIQLSRAFDLHAAAGLAGYLDALGISHVYASPFLAARAGSPHGYDITDHNTINPEIGGTEGFDHLHRELSSRSMGCILDFVPNHMGIGRADNPWWLDILEWGRLSPYAEFFDIDWEPAKPELHGKVLVPFLGGLYGDELEAGALQVEPDFSHGSFAIIYHDHRFPIAPRAYGHVLGPALSRMPDGKACSALQQLRDAFNSLPKGGVTRSRRAGVRARAQSLKLDLAALIAREPAVATAIGQAVSTINGDSGRPRSFVALHRLLQAQVYRLSFWRVAADDINYRRFFDINELAALRVERQNLFDVIHRLVFSMLDAGKLDGLRIDHIDGLYDPRQYCDRVVSRLGRNAEDGAPYLVVEKILATGERLPEDWPVDGTTGYDFANQVLGLFVDGAGKAAIDRAYRRFTGCDTAYAQVLRDSKKHVLRHLLTSELQVLANELERIAEATWRTRDFTLNTLRDALAEVVACFPVYRTYVDARETQPAERAHIAAAVHRARRHSAVPSHVFDFLAGVMATDFARHSRRRALRRRVVAFAMKFQQLTSPVAAKGEEDTAFYRYPRLLALNEVGGDPDSFGISPTTFHAENQYRSRRWPRSMLTTSTHDSKRGEDVRARLAVLSEIPARWEASVRQWARLNRHLRSNQESGPAPDRNDEYLFYQTLVGSWPTGSTDRLTTEASCLAGYRERLRRYMIKAVREAKVRSSWAEPDDAYEAAVRRFVDGALDPVTNLRFLEDVAVFQRRIADAGAINGLSQTLLKLAVPGVPDTYQGCELWNFSLVDPDNRRPVDFERRRSLLRELEHDFSNPFDSANAAGVRALFDEWGDGRIKLYLTWRLLGLRKSRPAIFDRAAYMPLRTTGAKADHLVAFARVPVNGTPPAIFAATRLVAGLQDASGGSVCGQAAWLDTTVGWSDGLDRYTWRDVLTGERVPAFASASGSTLSAAAMFANLPVAALVGE